MSPMHDIDTLISASWIIPMEPRDTVLIDHALAIKGHQIVGLCPTDQASQHYRWQQHIDLPKQVLMPGLINAHGHAAMSLLRGLADDYPLMTWLNDYIWPTERQFVDERFVHDGVELAMAEMLLSGTTCFHDMYFFPEKTAETAHQLGMRALVTFPVFDFPSAWGNGPDDYIHKGLSLFDDYKHSQYVSIGFGPHAPYTVSDEPLSRIATFAEELDLIVHMHVHETAHEVENAITGTGKRPLQRLADLGLLSPRFHAVHMTQVIDADIDLLHRFGAHVIHCPQSNLKLASGLCPVEKLTRTSINVALGTDGAASNNSLDMFGELKTAALLAKVVAQDATALSAHSALRMATLNGARAMGKEEQLGSLLPGKQADLIAVDLSGLAHQPIYCPSSHLAYTQCANAVSHVWCNGQLQVKNSKLTRLNQADLREKAQYWQQRIRRES